MKRTIFHLILLIAAWTSVPAQAILERDAITVSGGAATTPELIVTQSVGQVATLTLQNENIALTQGFQQPSDLVTSVTTIDVLDNLQLYPNPASDISNLLFSTEEGFEMQLELINPQGQVMQVLAATLVNGSNRIELDLSQLPKGLYFLRLLNEQQQLINTMKVIVQ